MYLFLFFIEIVLLIKINQRIQLSSISKIILFFLIFIFQTTILILTLHFKSGKHFLYFLFSTIDKSVIIQDPQDYLRVLWDSGLILTYFNFVISTVFFIYFISSNILRKEEYIVYVYYLLLFFYLLIVSLVLFGKDILFYHWEIFYTEKMFDFQPELLVWFKHYHSEFKDLIIILSFIFLLYLIFFFSTNTSLYLLSKNLFWRFLPSSLFSFYALYLFGGETLGRDLWLILLSFISGEFFIFSKICFEKFKRYKNLQ